MNPTVPSAVGLAAELPPGSVVLHEPDPGGTGKGQWWWGKSPLREVRADQPHEVLPALKSAEEAVARGKTVAGYVCYEAAAGLDRSLVTFPATAHQQPLVHFGVYDALTPLPELPALSALAPLPSLHWTQDTDEQRYHAALERIHDAIQWGETYQVNYTWRLRTAGVPDIGWPLFQHLYQRQPVPFAAFLRLGEFDLCSLSPELFFRLDGASITTRPMKGTAPRSSEAGVDAALAAGLLASEKDRAENVMIVDMLRNDLGRIAIPGSVQVPSLFTLERYVTVHQMTSTIVADTTASLSEIFRALFPCASVTGAPKVATMRLIRDLEQSPRGVYCGAIGFWQPQRRAQFSVGIRTLALHRPTGDASFGVGSGIVWDSNPADEYQECLTKGLAITGLTASRQDKPASG
ncbi:MAG: Isochorismate synthase MenF [bacterium]|nr:Isochorismate synthase MenF [bacterium]